MTAYVLIWLLLCRSAAEDNTEEGEEAHDPVVVKELTNAIRSSVPFYIPDDECGTSSSTSDEDEAGDGVVWPTSGVQAEAYRKRMLIWKNEIKGKG